MQSPFNTDVLNFPKCSGCHINNNSTQLKQAMYWILGKHLHFKELLLLLLSRFSHVRLCVTPQMAAHQAPLSLGFSRQEHWSGLPLPSPMHESEKWNWSCSVTSDSSGPHGVQPTRLLRPWDFPGKSTGVGCHCLLQHGSGESFKNLCSGRHVQIFASPVPWPQSNSYSFLNCYVVPRIFASLTRILTKAPKNMCLAHLPRI